MFQGGIPIFVVLQISTFFSYWVLKNNLLNFEVIVKWTLDTVDDINQILNTL